MKKYFIKISAIFLLVVIFPTTADLCLESLLSLSVGPKIAQAAVAQIDNNELQNLDYSACTIEQDSAQQMMTPLAIFATPVNLENLVSPIFATSAVNSNTATTKHNNTLLPCCVNGSHYGLTIISQLIDSEKNNIIIPSFFCSEYQISKVVLSTAVYYNPITAPPELALIKTTVLRL